METLGRSGNAKRSSPAPESGAVGAVIRRLKQLYDLFHLVRIVEQEATHAFLLPNTEVVAMLFAGTLRSCRKGERPVREEWPNSCPISGRIPSGDIEGDLVGRPTHRIQGMPVFNRTIIPGGILRRSTGLRPGLRKHRRLRCGNDGSIHSWMASLTSE